MSLRPVFLKPVPERVRTDPYRGGLEDDPRVAFFSRQDGVTTGGLPGYGGHEHVIIWTFWESLGETSEKNTKYYYRKNGDKLEPLGKFLRLEMAANQTRQSTLVYKGYLEYKIVFHLSVSLSDPADELYYTDNPPLEENVPLTFRSSENDGTISALNAIHESELNTRRASALNTRHTSALNTRHTSALNTRHAKYMSLKPVPTRKIIHFRLGYHEDPRFVFFSTQEGVSARGMSGYGGYQHVSIHTFWESLGETSEKNTKYYYRKIYLRNGYKLEPLGKFLRLEIPGYAQGQLQTIRYKIVFHLSIIIIDDNVYGGIHNGTVELYYSDNDSLDESVPLTFRSEKDGTITAINDTYESAVNARNVSGVNARNVTGVNARNVTGVNARNVTGVNARNVSQPPFSRNKKPRPKGIPVGHSRMRHVMIEPMLTEALVEGEHIEGRRGPTRRKKPCPKCRKCRPTVTKKNNIPNVVNLNNNLGVNLKLQTQRPHPKPKTKPKNKPKNNN